MTMNDLVVTSAIWRQDNTDNNVSLPSPTNVDSFLTQSMHERSLLCASSSSSSSLSNNEQDDDVHDVDVHAVDGMKINTTTAIATTTSLLMMPFQKPPLANNKNNSSSHHTRITVAATQSTLPSAPSASSSSASSSLIITEYKEDEDNKHHQQQQDNVDEYRNEQEDDQQQDYDESNEERDIEESKDQDHNMLWRSTMLLDASVTTNAATDITTIVKESVTVAEAEVEVEANNDIVGDLLLLEQKVEEENLRNDDESKNNSSSSSSTCSSSSHGLVVDQMESSENENENGNENENENEIIYYNNDSTDDESNSLWFINTFHRQNKSGTIEGRGQDLSGRGGATSTRTERTIAFSSVMNINESSSDDTTIFPKDDDDDENENDDKEVEVEVAVEKKVQGSSSDKTEMELEYYDGTIIDDKLTLEDQEEEIILYEYSHSYNWSSSEAEDTIHDKEDEQHHHQHQHQHDFEDIDDEFEDSVMEEQEEEEEEEEDRKDKEVFFDACEDEVDEEDENDNHNNDRDRGREKLLSDLNDHCLCLTPQVKGGRARRGRGRGRHHGRRLVEDLVAPSVEQDSSNEDEQIEVEIHPNSNDEEDDTVIVVDAVAKQLRKNKRNNKKGASTAGTAITITTSSTTRKGCAADALYVLSSLALMECCGTTSVVIDDISGILSDASTTTSASLLVGEEEEPLMLPSSVLDDSDKSNNKIQASSSSHPRRMDLSDGRDNCRDEDHGDGSDNDNDHAAGPIVVDHRNSNDDSEENYSNNNKRNATVGESGHKKDPPTSLHCVDADDDDDHDDNISVLERQEKKVLEELIYEEDNSNITVSHGSFDVKQSLLILEDLLNEGEEEDDAELTTISFDAVDCDSFSVDAFHDDDDHSLHGHHLLRVPRPPVLSLPATGRSNASFLQGIDVMKGITKATTAIGPVDPPEQISQTSVTPTTKIVPHRDCNGTNFSGFSTSASSSFDVPTLSSSDDFLIPCPPPADVPEANSNTTPRFVPLQLTIGSIAEDSLRKTRKCLPLVPSSPSNRYLLLNTKSNNVDIDDQENCTPRGGQQLKYRSNTNIFKASDADNNNDSPYFTTSKISVNIEGVVSSIALKGIMRKKQEGPIDDDRHQRRVHWDEQQLASKVEKGVMFSSRRGRRSICALDSLMLQITTVQDGYTNELGNHSSHSNDTHGYIC